MHPKYSAGVIAVGIYLAILALVFFYFGYHSKTESTRFVTRNDKAIAVTLQSPRQAKPRPEKKSSSPVAKKLRKGQTKPKPIPKPKPTVAKPKAKPPKRKTPAKKIKPKHLFSGIKTSSKPKSRKKPVKTSVKSPRKPLKNTPGNRTALANQHAKDKGIENRYLARVQERLYGWPAQSNFAGSVLTIGLTIRPSGRFDYEVLRPSGNGEFDRTVTAYLDALRTEGFGPTPKGKTYRFKVEIVAK
jgi:protein TonB